ncbi:MAG: hypothetical protein LBQ14_07935 [Treponema sp.]|jgi:hypothetical protein|nr:hypothetical protein [Treponema sp.]
MLITNFAAGELSETLFGRIDLPQYYQGVSFLENFEVIPTGGIERRNGTKRIRRMEEEGRIIPFIISRDDSFLLYLIPEITQGDVTAPARIRIYRNGVQQGTDVVSTAALPLPRTMAEINEVQYAQNYDQMILVHENYAPLRVYLVNTELYVLKFSMVYKTEIIAAEGINTSEYNGEYDRDYNTNSYLNGDGNNPRAVSFFNGRLVFAGTKNNPQRLFFSSLRNIIINGSEISNIHNFSTYKLFLTEQRNYVILHGTLDPDDRSKLILTADEPVPAFQGRPEKYIVDSVYFPPEELGEVRIESFKGRVVTFTGTPALIGPLSPEEEKEINDKISAYAAYNTTMTEYTVGSKTYRIAGGSYYAGYDVKLLIGANQYQFKEDLILNQHPTAELKNTIWYDLVSFPDDMAETLLNIKEGNYLRTLLMLELDHVIASEDGALRLIGSEVYQSVLFSAADELYRRIIYTMSWDFRGTRYYGKPTDIKERVIGQVGTSAEMYIPVYLPKIIEDRTPTPDDGFTFEIASDMSDAIRWLGQNKNILIGTETAEWVIPAGTNATNVQAILNSRYGSDKIQATSVGDAMCFFQSGRKALVEYYIPQQDNNFRANNMAMLSKNMLHESAAFDFDFISAPYTKIFVSREDGIIVALLYERSTGTFAWGRIRTGGHIRSVAAVPGPSGYDDVYLIVEREGEYFLEMLAERRRSADAPDAEVFLDSYGPWTGDAAGYTDAAVIYDELNNKTYPVTEPPPVGARMWIGYPYTSRVRSMPVLANDRMKQNIIKNLHIRFSESFLPRIKSLPNGKEDTIVRSEPYSGIIQLPFPGVWDRDVFFELIHDKPTRCRVLAVNAEAN